MRRKKCSGFTLIELMIVVAIIAILMAYAIPAYRNYTVKAKAGEGISMTSSLKTAISLIWTENSTLAGVNNGTNGISAATSYTGNNVSQIAVNAGVIQVSFNNDPYLNGETLTMTPAVPGTAGNTGGSIQWVCTSSLDSQYLPSQCTSIP